MKLNLRFLKVFALAATFVTLGATDAFGSNYYSKAQVGITTGSPTGAGTVYVATSQNATSGNTSATYSSQSSSGSANHTYFTFATANEGYEFKGWATSADATEPISTDNPYRVTINTTSTKSSDPTTGSWYAIFSALGAPEMLYGEGGVHEYINVGETVSPTLNTNNITETIQYSSSNTRVATVAADGTVTGVAAGSATITAQAQGVQATFIVTVLDYTNPYQVGNSNFEDWSNVTSSNNAPKNWNSFQTAEGAWKSTVNAQQVDVSNETRPGSNGMYSAVIYSRSVFGIPAQGNMTTGCINAGSTTPTDAANHNFTKTSDPNKSEEIPAIPDAMKVWVKFTPGAANAEHPNAHVAAIVHDNYNYIIYGVASNDKEANMAHVIAENEVRGGEQNDYPGNFSACDWTELTLPFHLSSNNIADMTKPYYILINCSTNADPGEGQANDKLYIDDISLVYSSEISTATYDGTPITFTAGAATVDAPYSEELLSIISGHSASIIKNYDTESGLLTLTVKGADYEYNPSNIHTYTIQFTVGGGNTVSLDKYAAITVNGQTAPLVPITIQVTENEDGTIDFALTNFILESDGNEMPVGNIAIPGLTPDTDGNISFSGPVTIAAGDKPGVDFWMGPLLGTLPVSLNGTYDTDYAYVNIDIDLSATLGQIINVEVGDRATATASISSVGIGTFCAPFKVILPAGVTASTVTSADANGVLTLTPLATEYIPAHTAVIIQCPIAASLPIEGIYTRGTATTGLLQGTYEDITAPVGSYVLQNLSYGLGFYKVAAGQEPTIRANRCYVPAALGSSVKAFIFESAETEGISNVTTTTIRRAYDLQGRTINGSTKGISIMNGNKIIR